MKKIIFESKNKSFCNTLEKKMMVFEIPLKLIINNLKSCVC